MLANSPADILRYSLIGTGFCTDPTQNHDWPGYVNYLPDVPDNAVMLTDIEGRMEGRIQRTGSIIEHPGIQIIVRALDQPTGWTKIRAICDQLDTVKKQLVPIGANTFTIVAVTRKGGIIPLGMEQHYKILERQEKEVKRRRFMFVTNTIITVR